MVVGLMVAAAAWRRRPALGSLPLVLLELLVAQWAFANAFEAAAAELPAKILWSQISYVGIVGSPVMYLLFALEYGRQDKWLTRRNIALLCLVPACTLLIAITNDWHHWLWSSIWLDRDRNTAIYGHSSVWFWVHIAYSYALVMSGMIALYRAIFRFSAFYRHQIGALLVGSTMPLAGNILYVSGFTAGLDWTPAVFALSGAVLAWGIFRYQMLDLGPVARTQLVESMVDGVLVLDGRNRIVDINPAAQRLLTDSAASLIGHPAQEVLPAWPDLAACYGDAPVAQCEIVLKRAEPRFVDLRLSTLYDGQNRPAGRLMVLRDVTRRKRAEEELRQANERLQVQLSEIETLQAKLREQAIRDPLTDAFNRRYLEETLVWELAQAQREERPLSLVMMDIDHFKTINDRYGHQAGDLYLQRLVSLVEGLARKGDILCRFGGEEFVVVMLNAPLPYALQRAEQWRAAVDGMKVKHGDAVLQATFSLGVAAYPQDGDTGEELLKAADGAMYAAKDAGRNCVRPH